MPRVAFVRQIRSTTGFCTFLWNLALTMWELAPGTDSEACMGNCACAPPLRAGEFDGESVTTPCGDPPGTSGEKCVDTPIFTLLPEVICDPVLPDERLMVRQVATIPGSVVPLMVYAYACCDLVRDTYVRGTCWPLSIGPGIYDEFFLDIYPLESCLSGYQRVVMVYDSGTGNWHGSATFIGGALDLTVICNEGIDPHAPAKFTLEWTGCDEGSISSGYTCANPLLVNFGNVDIPNCCCCPLDRTTILAGVNILFSTNCHPVRFVRQISSVGPNGLGLPEHMPVMAYTSPCDLDPSEGIGCVSVQCGLEMTVTSDDPGTSGCNCLEDTYDFNYEGTGWQVASVGCGGSGLFTMSCTQNPDGTMVFALTFTCGANNSGSGSVTIDPEDLDDLDIVIDLVVTGLATCEGLCVYDWNAMAASWTLNSGASTCTVTTCEDCPNGPDDSSPGSVDGEQRSQPCTPSEDAGCCDGSISAHITRICTPIGGAAPMAPPVRESPQTVQAEILPGRRKPPTVTPAVRASRRPEGGPGTELRELLHSLRIKSFKRCKCNVVVAHMDLWGVDGCKSRYDWIVDYLRDNQQRLNMVQTLTAAGRAVITGLAFKLNPLDPAPGLVTEAIRRAEEKEKGNE